jgi:type II secretory pathway pseudopilin PulG
MASTLDLLNLLASGLGTSESINHMSGKTSASNDQVTAALLSALPSMLGQMKTNASTQTGATSLMNALSQHDLSKLSNEDIVSLIKNADEKDGVKILNHLYGSQAKTEAAQASLAQQSGVSTAQMAKIMAIAAPALLTAVAAAKKKQAAQAAAEAAAAQQAAQAKKTSESDELMALLQSLSGVNVPQTTGKPTTSGKKTSSAKDNGMDLGDIMQMASALSGNKPKTTSSAKKNDGLDLGDILQMAGALSGSGKKTQQSSGMASLLGTLLQGKKLF